MILGKRFFYIIAVMLLCSSPLYSQVGINTITPHASSALDVQSPGNNQGVLLPRMTTIQKNAIVNPAVGLLVYDTDRKCISQNAGTPASPLWVCLMALDTHTKTFYMPSVAVDASVVATNQTLDLYDEYKKQFGTPTAVSTGAPASLPYFPSPTDLYYYVTQYDTSVLNITSINASGVMTYDVIQAAAYDSFMNVVFAVK
ncbi:hypothetical protein [Dysgonomonas sp. HDW5A]|uniref:hypothetical protein n=1 Tax=Dysgonomonas sp. HDW5A TaxID=2714926 RepID=UPI001C88815B|nr:hypothetical protein [Dysgonomonas sp. HDW5A]